MNRIHWLAWPALTFGIIGIALSLAAIVAVSISSAQIQSSVDKVFSRADVALTTAHVISNEVADSITDSRQYLSGVNQRMEEKVLGLSTNAPTNPSQVEALTISLVTVSQHVQSWFTLFESAIQLSELIEELIDATIFFFRSDNQIRHDTLIALENGHAQLQETLVAVDELITQWEDIRSNPKSPPNIQPFFSRIDHTLVNAQQYSIDFTQGLTKLQSATNALQSRLKRRLTVVTLIISLLLVWNAAAQFTLARWGWQNRLLKKIPR